MERRQSTSSFGRRRTGDVRARGEATAYPKAKGIWRDDENGGALVGDEPVVVHCYTTPSDIENAQNLAELGRFCRKMDERRSKGRSAWSSAMSTSQFTISQRSRR